MGDEQPTSMIFAAGGLLWRDGDDVEDSVDSTDVDDVRVAVADRQVAVVHRPRYDDWSLPKGKLEPGELLPETAVREVREETGFAVSRAGFAGRYQYDVSAGPKTVFVWHMRVVDDLGRPDDEVDELVWLTPRAALDRLTYAHERDLIRRVLDAGDA